MKKVERMVCTKCLRLCAVICHVQFVLPESLLVPLMALFVTGAFQP